MEIPFVLRVNRCLPKSRVLLQELAVDVSRYHERLRPRLRLDLKVFFTRFLFQISFEFALFLRLRFFIGLVIIVVSEI